MRLPVATYAGAGYDSKRARRSWSKTSGISTHLQTVVKSSSEGSYVHPFQRAVRSRRVCRLWQLAQRSRAGYVTAPVDQLAKLSWALRESAITASLRHPHLHLRRLGAVSSPAQRPESGQNSRTVLASASVKTAHVPRNSRRLLAS